MAEKKEKQYVRDNAHLMAEWHWEKNSELGLNPQKLTSGSGRKVWWRCSKGHEWQARIVDRTNGIGCPYCAGLRAIKGENDLQTINPTLAEEWNYEKNAQLAPSDVRPNSGKKVWWKCGKAHEWQARIQNRSRGQGCPYCSGRNAIKGLNDLLTVNPSLANEWDNDKNIGLTPSDVLPNSQRKVWWKCSSKHYWMARIADRNCGQGCPQCARENREKTL